MASTYLNRTPSSAGNRRIFTISTWLKGHDTAALGSGYFFGAVNGSNTDTIGITASGLQVSVNSATSGALNSTRLFRDLSAFYHIVWSVDTTQATASNRMKVYVNGEQITDWDTETYPTQNYDFGVNNTVEHRVGALTGSTSNTFSGVMAHFHFIDGTAYAASAFGETDSTTGIWKPKTAPSVTYGTNGFFLKFASSGSLGTDSSGNGNNFTLNGSGTQTQDTPSNVFATINPNWKTFNDNPTFSNSNLTISPTTTAYQNHFSTLGVQGSGKWYVEMKVNGSSNSAMYYGISNEAELNYLATNSNVGGDSSYNYMIAMSSGDKRTNGSNSSYGSAFSDGDIMMFALDLDNSKVYFGKNGTWFNSGDPAAGTNPAFSDVLTNTFYFFGGTAYQNGFTSVNYNFGNGYFGTTAVSSANSDDAGLGLFEYAPPTGYYSLCTKNINTYG